MIDGTGGGVLPSPSVPMKEQELVMSEGAVRRERDELAEEVARIRARLTDLRRDLAREMRNAGPGSDAWSHLRRVAVTLDQIRSELGDGQ